MSAATCDLCGSDRLALVYDPGSARGLTVYLCERCGLVQSLPRIDAVPVRRVAVSSGVDWGNLRYGKGLRTQAALDLLGDLSGTRACLDVGSNRGDFVLRLREQAPGAAIDAIEPDAGVVDEYRDRCSLTIGRLEHVELPTHRYDLIYCSHTLEHLAAPREETRRLATALAPGGRLFIEVPNLDLLDRDDLVEEWFIDKHLYHFSRATLLALLATAGLSPRSSRRHRRT